MGTVDRRTWGRGTSLFAGPLGEEALVSILVPEHACTWARGTVNTGTVVKLKVAK